MPAFANTPSLVDVCDNYCGGVYDEKCHTGCLNRLHALDANYLTDGKEKICKYAAILATNGIPEGRPDKMKTKVFNEVYQDCIAPLHHVREGFAPTRRDNTHSIVLVLIALLVLGLLVYVMSRK